jgi:hypothetical protein
MTRGSERQPRRKGRQPYREQVVSVDPFETEVGVISTERTLKNPLGMQDEWRALVSVRTEGERRRHREFFVQLATTWTHDWLSAVEVIAFVLEQTPKTGEQIAEKEGKNRQSYRLVKDEALPSRRQLDSLGSSPAVVEARAIIAAIDDFYTNQHPTIVKWTVRPDSVTTFGLQGQLEAVGRMATLADMIGAQLSVPPDLKREFGANIKPPQFFPMVLRSPQLMALMNHLQVNAMKIIEMSKGVVVPYLFYQETNPAFLRIGDMVRSMQHVELAQDHYNLRTDILTDIAGFPWYSQEFNGHSLESVLAQEDDSERAYQLLELIIALPKGDAIIQELIALLFVPMTGNAPVESIHHPELLQKLVKTLRVLAEKLFFPALEQQLALLPNTHGERDGLEPLTTIDKKFDRLFSFALTAIDHTIVLDIARALHSTALLGDSFLTLLEHDLANGGQEPQALDLESGATQPFSRLAWLEQMRIDHLRNIHQPDYRLADVMRRAMGDIATSLTARFGTYNGRKVELLLTGFEQFADLSPEQLNGNILLSLANGNLGESFVRELSARVQELAGVSQVVLRELYDLNTESDEEFAYFGTPGVSRIVEFDQDTLPSKLGLQGVHFVTREDGAVEFLLFPTQFSDNTIFGLLSGGDINEISGANQSVPNIALELELPEEFAGIKLLIEHCVITTFYDLCVRQRKHKQVIDAASKDVLRGRKKVESKTSELDSLGQQTSSKSSTPISLPRVTVTAETMTLSQLQTDLEAAEAGTRVFTPRDVPAHSRYLKGGERYHWARVGYEQKYEAANDEEKMKLQEELVAARRALEQPSANKREEIEKRIPTLERAIATDLHSVVDPITGEQFFEKTLIEWYPSPKMTAEEQDSLRVFHQQRYKSRLGRSAFLNIISDWVGSAPSTT